LGRESGKGNEKKEKEIKRWRKDRKEMKGEVTLPACWLPLGYRSQLYSL
jgi:hypothetical protein